MVKVRVDCNRQTHGSSRLVWFGLRVGARLVVIYIHQMNRVNNERLQRLRHDDRLDININIISHHYAALT